MHSAAILTDMADTGTTSTRQLAGAILLEEIARLPGRNKTQHFLDVAGISPSTLRNIRRGYDSVTELTLWAAAAALNLPTHFFELIIAADGERLKQLPGVREDLRQHVLEQLAEIDGPRGRRATDRRRRG